MRQQAVKRAPSMIGPLFEEKFTEEELKLLIAIIESSVNRKYMKTGGELQKALGGNGWPRRGPWLNRR